MTRPAAPPRIILHFVELATTRGIGPASRCKIAECVIGMMPGITGLSTPWACATHELEVVVGLEEELRHREVGNGQLLRRMATVGLDVGGTRVRLGVRGDSDGEVADATNQTHEIDRVLELPGRQLDAGRRVAAKRQDVVDAGVPVSVTMSVSSSRPTRGAPSHTA
jgi:hypothetical protein